MRPRIGPSSAAARSFGTRSRPDVPSTTSPPICAARLRRSSPRTTRPSRTRVGVGELLRAIHGYRGNAATRYALKLAALTFVRPGELRHATWTEFQLDHAEWRIPAERMKMREQHIVPLSRQAVELLRELQVLSRRSSYLFPALGNARRPMSENTVNAALRRLGYAHDEMTGHGFRSMASTLLNEQGWHPDLIELQPGAALGRTAPDDAGMGGLLGSAPGRKDCDRGEARGGCVRARCAWTEVGPGSVRRTYAFVGSDANNLLHG
jgi:integrase